MTRSSKLLTVMLVAALGIWGCARGPANQSAAQAEKIRGLENKCSKLEEDYKAVAGARDQAKHQLGELEEEAARLKKELSQLRGVVRDRDNIKHQLESRTTERDTLQTRCDRMKKGLQNLLGQDDAMLSSPPTTPLTSSASGPSLNPS
jgi:septal ring factor EnvC (AmiA/AmiB activator)